MTRYCTCINFFSAVLAIALAVPSGRVFGADDMTIKTDSILRWFPENTEAFAIVNGDYEISRAFACDMSGTAMDDVLDSAFCRQFHGHGLHELLRGVFLNRCVIGRRRFHQHHDIILAEDCVVMVLRGNYEQKLRDLYSALIGRRASKFQNGDLTVIGKGSLAETRSVSVPFYVCVPQSNVLIIANDHNFLDSIIAGMRLGKGASLPKLVGIDRMPEHARIWGMRRYVAPTFADVSDQRTPTKGSPVRGNAEGFFFEINDSANVAIARWIGCDPVMQLKVSGADPGYLMRDYYSIQTFSSGDVHVKLTLPEMSSPKSREMRGKLLRLFQSEMWWNMGYAGFP